MNEIQNLYNKINPTSSPDETAEKIIAGSVANGRTQRRSSRAWKRPVVAAAALACAAALTVSVSAAGGFGVLLDKLFGNSQIAYDMQKTAVFHDEDGNISIDVDELISDGMCTYATVHYTALNDAGRAWLQNTSVLYSYSPTDWYDEDGNLLSMKEIYNGRLHLSPRGFYDDLDKWKFKNGNLNYEEWKKYHYEGAWKAYIEDLNDMGTEDERYYMLILELEKKDTSGNEVSLLYPMTDETRLVSISAGAFAKERLIMIDFEYDADKYYVPKCLRVSQTSATLYGDFTKRSHGERTYKGIGNPLDVSMEKYEDFYKNTYLVMSDGTKLYFRGESGRPIGTLSEDNEYSKYVLLSSVFDKESGHTGMKGTGSRITIDPDDVVGIQIEDKYYSFIDSKSEEQ